MKAMHFDRLGANLQVLANPIRITVGDEFQYLVLRGVSAGTDCTVVG